MGVSSITTADAHTSTASSRLNWRPRRFKWTRPFRRKKKSGFCACTITFQTQSTLPSVSISKNFCSSLHSVRVVVARSVKCLGHWLVVRGILIQFPAGKESFRSTKYPDELRNVLRSLYNGYRVLFPRGSSGCDVKLTTHSNLLTKYTNIRRERNVSCPYKWAVVVTE